MDVKHAEQMLAAIGKVYRLSRLYPPSHPAVARAQAELAVALPPLAAEGPAEWKVKAQGFFLRERPLLGRNPALTELAQLLFARGVRAVTVRRGASADDIEGLVRVATGAVAVEEAGLGGVELTVGRKSTAAARGGAGAAGRRNAAADVGRSFRPPRAAAVPFRPDALPPDIAARRLARELSGRDGPGDSVRLLAHLEEVAPGVAELGDVALAAEVVGALRSVPIAEDDGALRERVRALAGQLVGGGLLAQLARRVGEVGVAPDERRMLVGAAAVLVDRLAPLVVELYVPASTEARAAYLAVARAAGEAAVEPLMVQLGAATPEAVAAAVDLLGATGSAVAFELLVPCTHHAAPLVRERALAALTEIGGRDLGRLAAAQLKDPEPRVRRAAAQALAAALDPGAVAVMLGRLKDETAEPVLVALLSALGRLGGANVVEALAAYAGGGLLRASHPTAVRVAAAGALAALGTPEARATLARLITDREPAVREVAMGATS